ncbi:hypothetical protein ACHQM5_018114 [Ranunculus cassubicifolius]
MDSNHQPLIASALAILSLWINQTWNRDIRLTVLSSLSGQPRTHFGNPRKKSSYHGIQSTCRNKHLCSNAGKIRKFLIEKQPAECRGGKSSWSILHRAATTGDLPTVKDVIRFWPDCCDLLDNFGQNFLHLAARCGRVNVVKYVLELKNITANVLNGRDLHGNTPLHFAMSSNDASIALALLDDQRVNKLIKNMDGKNPLDLASGSLLKALPKVVIQFASKGDVDFFSAIREDVFRNARDENGESVLSTAVAKGHFNCCDVILERCKELLYQTNKNGHSSLHTAVSNGQDEILDLLLQAGLKDQKSVDTQRSMRNNMLSDMAKSMDTNFSRGLLTMVSGDQKQSALHLAVERGNLASAKLLLMTDDDSAFTLLSMENLHKDTAMHIAVKGHHLEIVTLLLGAQRKIFEYSTNENGCTPLLIALEEAASGDRRAVEIRNLLIARQPNQCTLGTGIKNWVLIHHAAHKGDISAITEIMRFNPAHCGFLDTEGYSILHLAAKFNQVGVVQYIKSLRNIADLLNLEDNYGNTPAHVAVSCGNVDLAEHLLSDHRFENKENKLGKKASDVGPSVPFQCAQDGDLDFFRAVQVNVLRDSRNHQGDSLFFVAVRQGHLNCCEVISKTCPELLYIANQNGDSPLHMATSNGNYEIVKLLLEADTTKELLRMKDNHNKTALHYAVEGNHLENVKLLVEADPTFSYPKNQDGETPLTIAFERAVSGDQTTVKIRSYLIEKQSEQILEVRIGEEDRTLLQYAISKQDLSAMEEIVRFCPECLPLVDKYSRNILHHAVILERVELVNFILGIKDISESVLNGKDNEGDTPLHLATAAGYVDIALSLLYDSRVQKTIQNNKKKSALDKIDFVYDLSRAKVEGFPNLVDIKKLKEQSDFDLLVGALIATVSFTAGITVPGGFFSDGPNRGNPLLYKKRTFEAFVVFNTIALALSLFVVIVHFCRRHLVSKKDILLQLQMATFSLIGAIFAMLLAFIMGSFAVLSISLRLAIVVCVICCCFFAVSGYCLWMTTRQERRVRNQQSSESLLDRLVFRIRNWGCN